MVDELELPLGDEPELPPSGSMSLSRRLSAHPVITGEYKLMPLAHEAKDNVGVYHDFATFHGDEPPEIFEEPIYNQQLTEPDNYYAAFLQFCSLPQGRRFIKEGQELWHGTRLSRQDWNYEGVARKWKWLERAARRDIFMQQQVEEQWMRRDVERRERIYEIGNRLLNAGERGLNDIDEETITNPMAVTRLIALGHELTEASIPQAKLEPDELGEVFDRLPASRRKNVLEILMARITRE